MLAETASLARNAPLHTGIGRASVRLAWSLWALAVGLTGLSLLLLTLNLSHPGTHIFDWWLGNALVVIVATGIFTFVNEKLG